MYFDQIRKTSLPYTIKVTFETEIIQYKVKKIQIVRTLP